MVASSARLGDARYQREELSLPARRQLEHEDWVAGLMETGLSHPDIGTRQHRADIALAGDPQGRTMRRAAADEKPGCDQAKHSPTAIRHDLTITTGGDSATRWASVGECHPSGVLAQGADRTTMTEDGPGRGSCEPCGARHLGRVVALRAARGLPILRLPRWTEAMSGGRWSAVALSGFSVTAVAAWNGTWLPAILGLALAMPATYATVVQAGRGRF
jgi:hypothetical protein